MILLLNLAVFALIAVAFFAVARWWRQRRALHAFNDAQKVISSFTMTEGMFKPAAHSLFIDGVASGLMQKAEEPFPPTIYVPALDGTTTTYTLVKRVHGKYGSFALYAARGVSTWFRGQLQ